VNQKFFWVKKKVMNHAAESAIIVLAKNQPRILEYPKSYSYCHQPTIFHEKF
jgi:hypothetical protein